MHRNFWFDKDYFENNYSQGDKVQVKNLPYLPQEVIGKIGTITGKWFWFEKPLLFTAEIDLSGPNMWIMLLHHFEKVQ